jgi:hypothetical protein
MADTKYSWMHTFHSSRHRVRSNPKRVLLAEEIYIRSIASIYGAGLADLLFTTPVINVRDVIQGLKASRETASEPVGKFESAGILSEITGKKRYRKYAFREYVAIVARGTEANP